MMFGYGYGTGWMWLWGLLALAGLVVLIFVIVRVAAGGGVTRDQSHQPAATAGPPSAARTPREILDERYAKGELTTEEYQERLRVLGESG